MSIKSTLAAAAAAPFLLSSAAFAGPYVNVEANASYPDGDYTGATTDVAVGFTEQQAKVKLHTTSKVVQHSFILKLLMTLRLSSLVRQVLLLQSTKT